MKMPGSNPLIIIMETLKELPKFTEHQQKVLSDLCSIQDQIKQSDEDFARDHLNYSPTVWFRLKSGQYPVKDLDKVFVTLAQDLRRLREELAIANKRGVQTYHKFDHFTAVLKAITECRTKRNENRLVVYLADTGGGKSTLLNQVRKDFNGIIVEARESWRKSYFAACSDIALAAGASGAFRGEHDAEAGLITALQTRRMVMGIDEGEYFGPRTINLLKLILNETETVIVLCAIPPLFDRWNQAAWIESQQLKRRTHVVIRCPLIQPADVSEFLAGKISLGTDHKAGCLAIAKAANDFGKYDLITRVMEDLVNGPSDNPTLADVEKTVDSVKKSLRGN